MFLSGFLHGLFVESVLIFRDELEQFRIIRILRRPSILAAASHSKDLCSLVISDRGVERAKEQETPYLFTCCSLKCRPGQLDGLHILNRVSFGDGFERLGEVIFKISNCLLIEWFITGRLMGC